MADPARGINISESKLLVVEGKDEQNFFSAFMRHLGVAGIQVFRYRGEKSVACQAQGGLGGPKFYKGSVRGRRQRCR